MTKIDKKGCDYQITSFFIGNYFIVHVDQNPLPNSFKFCCFANKNIILRLIYSLFRFLPLPYPTDNKKSVQSLSPVAADFQPAGFDTLCLHLCLLLFRLSVNSRSRQVPSPSRVERCSLHQSEIYSCSWEYSNLPTSLACAPVC